MNDLRPEQIACFCHSLPLHQCPMFAIPAGIGPADQDGETTELITPSADKENTMAKKAQVHRRQFNKTVRIGLDPEDREPLVKQLTTALRDTDELKAEAANVAAGYRQKIKDLKDIIEEAALTLEQGKPEERLVEEVRNFGTNKLTIKDVESGKVYENRQMTEDDAQVPISDLPNATEPEDEDAQD